MRRIVGRCFHRQRYHALDVRIRNRPRRSRARLVQQPIDPLLNEPSPPLTDALARDTKFGSHCTVGLAARTQKYDPSTKGERLAGLWSSQPALKNDAIRSVQLQSGKGQVPNFL
jgi:hypothetical protein